MKNLKTKSLHLLLEQKQNYFLSALVLLFVVLLLLFLPIAAPVFFEQSARAQNSNAAIATASPAPTPAKVTVRGKVVYDDTGRPVRRASVILAGRQNLSGRGPGQVTLTDMNGSFEVKEVPAGDYVVIVNSPGLITPYGYADDVDLDRPSNANEKIFDVIKDEFTMFSVDGAKDLTVEVRAKRGGSISGKVTYPDGDPAVNISVNILRKKKEKTTRVVSGLSLESFFGVKTDDRGMYRVAGLPPGDYLVVASEPAVHTDKRTGGDSEFEILFGAVGSMLTTFYPNADTKEEATEVNVLAGQEQNEINIALSGRGLYKIAGTVVARSDKKPLKDVSVTLKRKEKIGRLTAIGPLDERMNRTSTDEQGNWSFKELPDGVYSIQVEPANDYEETSNPGGSKETKKKPKLSGKTQEIKILTSDITDVLIELSDGGRISGTVTMANGKPATTVLPATVRAKPIGDDADEDDDDSYSSYYGAKHTGYVDDKGKFSIEGLPAGPLNLEVGVREEIYVKSIVANGVDITNSPLNLTEGADVKNAQIVLGDDMGTLKGVLRSASGKPASLAVMLVPTNQAKWKARSSLDSFKGEAPNQNGEFSIKAAPGEYFIIFVPLTTPRVISDVWLKERTANAQRILLAPNATQTVTLTAPQ